MAWDVLTMQRYFQPVRGLFPLLLLLLERSSALTFSGSRQAASTHGAAVPESCGPLKAYPHARPKSYADARTTRWDKESNATIPVTFAAGDVIEFTCLPGYTVDGSLDGTTTFQVTCTEHGYYTVSHVCLEESKCGAVPAIPHAMPTGKVVRGSVEMACSQGYSLDGEQVVAGGLGKNRFFMLKCNEFSGEYEAFKGSCQAYAFVPGKESIRIYNQVFEALFIVTCRGTLKKAFAAGGEPPETIDQTCASFEDASLSSQCRGLVNEIKSDFESKWQEMEQYNDARKSNGTEWYDPHTSDRPSINKDATDFCEGLWALLEIPAA